MDTKTKALTEIGTSSCCCFVEADNPQGSQFWLTVASISAFQEMKFLFHSCSPGLSQGVLGRIFFFILIQGRELCHSADVTMKIFSTLSGT